MGPSPLAAVGSPWWKAVGRPGDGFSRFRGSGCQGVRSSTVTRPKGIPTSTMGSHSQRARGSLCGSLVKGSCSKNEPVRSFFLEADRASEVHRNYGLIQHTRVCGFLRLLWLLLPG